MQRHFDKGDLVTILEGKYTGETGSISQKIERLGKRAALPHAIYLVRLDRGQNEIHVKASNIRLRSEQNRDIKKLLDMCRQGEFAARKKDGGGGSSFKVNDLVLFNGGKTYGHVIQVLDECLRVIDDSNQLKRLNPKDVDKRVERNRSAVARDMASNVLQIEDVVRCCGQQSAHRGKKGIIVNVCRTCLFLWDPKDYEHTGGVFAERAMNVMILGNEFLQQADQASSGYMTQNRITRDKLLNRHVNIVRGTFKGYRGIVSGVHGEEAIVELSSKAKKVTVPKNAISEIDVDQSTIDLQMTDNTRPQNTAGNSQYGPVGGRSVYGGASQHGGLYDGGKTPAMFT